jgi:replicative DNA helicase
MPKKAPPHDLDAERAVLGAILMRNKAYLEIRDRLTTQDFYRHAHGLIFDAIEDLHAGGTGIDLITVKAALKRAGKIKEVGVAYLSGLTDGVPRSTNIQMYSDMVVDCAGRRRLQEVCWGALEDIPAAQSAEAASTQLVDGARGAVQLRGDEGHTLAATLRELIESLDDPVVPTTTGLPTLDGMGCGFRPGELTLLAGRPSHGKTALALHMAKAASEDGLPVHFCSLEMSREALTTRWLASDADVWFSALRGANLTQTEFAKVSASMERLSALPITIDDHPGIGLGHLRRAVVGAPKMLLIVDYLQLVNPPALSKGQTRTQEVGAISRGLKAIAHDCKISILALSQLNREAEHRGGDARLSDLRDSGELEQDCDLCFLVSKGSMNDDAAPKDLVTLRIAKHRNGPLGKLDLYFNGANQQFRERRPEDASVPEESGDESKMKGW